MKRTKSFVFILSIIGIMFLFGSMSFAESTMQVRQSALNLEFQVYRTDDMPANWFKTYDDFYVTKRIDNNWVYGKQTMNGIEVTDILVGTVDPSTVPELNQAVSTPVVYTPPAQNKTTASAQKNANSAPNAAPKDDVNAHLRELSTDDIYQIISYSNVKPDKVVAHFKSLYGSPNPNLTTRTSYSYSLVWDNIPVTPDGLGLALQAANFDLQKTRKYKGWWIDYLSLIELTASNLVCQDLFDRRVQEFIEMLGTPALKRKTEVKWKILDNKFDFEVKMAHNGEKYYMITYSASLIF